MNSVAIQCPIPFCFCQSCFMIQQRSKYDFFILWFCFSFSFLVSKSVAIDTNDCSIWKTETKWLSQWLVHQQQLSVYCLCTLKINIIWKYWKILTNEDERNKISILEWIPREAKCLLDVYIQLHFLFFFGPFIPHARVVILFAFKCDSGLPMETSIPSSERCVMSFLNSPMFTTRKTNHCRSHGNMFFYCRSEKWKLCCLRRCFFLFIFFVNIN